MIKYKGKRKKERILKILEMIRKEEKKKVNTKRREKQT